jgi:myo-inositol-1(or 4)-monophosphatase
VSDPPFYSEAKDALKFARSVAAEAGALLRGASATDIRTKSTRKDLVTEWDTRLEEFILGRLAAETPRIPVLAEESAGEGATAGAPGPADERWVVDPIDGTVNFAHGVPWFGVCISLERAGRPIAGVVAAPALGWEFYGSAGGGAFKDGERLAVSTTRELSQALLSTGFPYDRATAVDNNFAEWEHFQRTAGACRRFGAASLDLCLVAWGRFDGYWERRLKPWDLSAGALFVTEAGGTVTSLTGGAFATDSGEALASNGAIHNDMVKHLAAVARAP